MENSCSTREDGPTSSAISEKPPFDTLSAWFAHSVERSPHRAALVWYPEEDVDCPVVLTYRQLSRKVEQLAGRLATLVSVNPLVGVDLPHSIELVVATLAILRCGGAFVPLDVHLPDERLSYVIADSGMGAVLTSTNRMTRHTSRTIPILAVDKSDKATLPGPAPTHVAKAGDLAYLLYTSGSTGRPKGVLIENGSITHEIVAFARAINFTVGASFLLSSGTSFDPWIAQVFVPLLYGGTLVLTSQEAVLTAGPLAEILERSRVDFMFHTPTIWQSLIDQGWGGAPFVHALSGGEAVSVELARSLVAMCGAFYNLYGPTETTIGAVGQRIESVEDVVPLGYPFVNVAMRILDSDLSAVPEGTWGELWLGGPLVGRGYHNRPDLTAERFWDDPLQVGRSCRFFRTGDRVRARSDGSIEFGGRFDDQIKINGVRVEVGEVEFALKACAGVREALVLARNRLDGTKMLVGYVVPTSEGAVRVEPIRDALAQLLLPAMLPEHIVVIDRIPIGPTGKIARDKLPEPVQVAKPVVAGVDPSLHADCSLGRFVQIVEAVLGRAVQDLNARFVDLGGTSLTAMLLVARVESVFSRRIRLRDVLSAPSIKELWQTIEQKVLVHVPQASAQPVESTALTPAEKRFLLLPRLADEPTILNIGFSLRLEPAITPQALQDAWSHLVERHEALRTTYVERDGTMAALVHGRLPIAVRVLERPCIDRERADAMVQEVRQAERSELFDLKSGPLHRVVLVRTHSGWSDIVVTLHHSVADGWSVGILINDLLLLLESASAGSPKEDDRFAKPAPSYRSAFSSARHHQGAEGSEFWNRHLGQGHPALDLPIDHVAARGAPAGVAAHRHCLNPEGCRQLQVTAQRLGTTPHVVLFAALYALVQRHSLASEVLIGSAYHGRVLPKQERIVGAFLKVLPIRLPVDGGESFASLVARVHDMLVDAYDHQDELDEALERRGACSSPSPGIQIYFNMLDFPSDYVGATLTASVGILVDPVAHFEFSFYAEPRAAGLDLVFVHERSLVGDVTGSALLDQWARLVDQATAAPEAALVTYRLLAPPRLPPSPTGPQRSVAEIFASVASACPGAVALDDGQQRLTYGELVARARHLSKRLRRHLGPEGGAVALCCGHSMAMVEAILGCMLAGCLYVPTDPRHPKRRSDHAIVDSGARVLVATDEAAQEAAELASRHGLDVLRVGDNGDTDPPDPDLVVNPETPAYILYTSGSTGTPKGVLQSQANVAFHALTYAASVGAEPGRRLALVASYAFDASVMDLFGALLTGAKLHLVDVNGDFGLGALRERLRAIRPHVFHATPTLFRFLVSSMPPGERLEGVEFVVLGGEAADRGDLDSFRRICPAGAVLINGLGPTESTMALQARFPPEREVTTTTLPVGCPVPGLGVLLVDDRGRDNEVFGEITICGQQVALGYWGRPDDTERAFAPDPADRRVRTYRTGDFGRRSGDGEIVHLGRRDSQVKLRGHRVELAEVEAVIREYAGLSEVACVLRTTDQPMLIAFVSGLRSLDFERSGRAWLLDKLPAVMIPSRILALGDLPRTPTGKIDRYALACLSVTQERRPASTRLATPHQAVVEAAWCGALGIKAVPRDATFYDLGGSSLTLARLQAELTTRTGHRIPLRQLLRLATVEDTAVYLARLDPGMVGDRPGALHVR